MRTPFQFTFEYSIRRCIGLNTKGEKNILFNGYHEINTIFNLLFKEKACNHGNKEANISTVKHSPFALRR